MRTASVMLGNADSGEMTCTPGFGMLNVIVSPPGIALALMMAWRSEPAPLSSVFSTTSVAALSMLAQAENSDVSPAGVVAVIVILVPTGRAAVVGKSKLYADDPAVNGTAREPRKRSP